MQFSTFALTLFLSVFMSLFAAAVPLAELKKRSVDITGTHSGDGTYFTPGLGACGSESSESDLIVAVGHGMFDNYPGYNGANPNNNPICGQKLTAKYNGKSVIVTVVDRCVGCNTYDLDFSPAAFSKLAAESVGRLKDVSWTFEGVSANTADVGDSAPQGCQV